MSASLTSRERVIAQHATSSFIMALSLSFHFYLFIYFFKTLVLEVAFVCVHLSMGIHVCGKHCFCEAYSHISVGRGHQGVDDVFGKGVMLGVLWRF